MLTTSNNWLTYFFHFHWSLEFPIAGTCQTSTGSVSDQIIIWNDSVNLSKIHHKPTNIQQQIGKRLWKLIKAGWSECYSIPWIWFIFAPQSCLIRINKILFLTLGNTGGRDFQFGTILNHPAEENSAEDWEKMEPSDHAIRIILVCESKLKKVSQ